MKSDEAQLVEACLKGDQRAYRRLYERYAKQMYVVCLRYSQNTAEAEDSLHDGFIKVFETLHRLKNRNALQSWIRTIMVNTAVNNSMRGMRTTDKEPEREMVSDNYEESEKIYDELDSWYLLEAIAELPKQYRLVFNLVEVEGYGTEEVAQRLGIAEVTVRSNLHRAKKQLMERLKNYRKK